MANLKGLYRSLESLHRAGISWPDALEAAAPGRMAEAKAAVRAGKPLSEALRTEVDALDTALLRAGESSGALESTLSQLAKRHEDQAKRRSELRSAIWYPVLVAHIGALLLGVPDLMQGRVLAAIGWAAMLLIPCWAWILLGARTQRAASGGDPIPPRFVHPFNQSGIEDADARALTALGDCLNAAVPLGETLRLAARAGAGGRIAADLGHASLGVASGVPISQHFKHTPPDVARALTVAEQTGDLSEQAREQADHLAFTADIRRQKFRSTMPIVMLLTIGGLVAYRVIGFYSQLYSLAKP